MMAELQEMREEVQQREEAVKEREEELKNLQSDNKRLRKLEHGFSFKIDDQIEVDEFNADDWLPAKVTHVDYQWAMLEIELLNGGMRTLEAGMCRKPGSASESDSELESSESEAQAAKAP